MVRRRRVFLACVAAWALGAVPLIATADGGLRMTMDGRLISIEEAATRSCHDFDYPVITCFRTPAEMLSAAQARARSSDAGDLTAAVGYIAVFEHGAYAGAAQAISQSYSYLGDIGWNDKISSLKSHGATGRFWEHAPSGGLLYYFYSTSQIPYVGDLYNDRFSAVYLN